MGELRTAKTQKSLMEMTVCQAPPMVLPSLIQKYVVKQTQAYTTLGHRDANRIINW